MTELDTRLAQFKKMADDDPNNELGHFSLGRAYLDANMTEQAIASFERAIEINPNLSKAYQLIAEAQLALGQRDAAIETLNRGVVVAHNRGDMLPKNAMIGKLRDLGAELPQLEDAAPPAEVGEGQVLCQRCGRVAARLPAPPFRNEQGKLIYEKICANCWREWIAMGTKVINELRLPLADPQAQKIYDQHMMEFLNLR